MSYKSGFFGSIAALFTPHEFNTRVDYNGKPPKVMFTWEVYNYLRTLVSIVNGPINWLGTVEKVNDDTYVITKIFLPAQEVTANAASIEPEGWAKLIDEITAKFPAEDGLKIINSLSFWGCTTTNTTLGADKDVRNQFAQSGKPFCILGSFSLQGKIELTMYQFEGAAMSFSDIPWGIVESENEALIKEITAEIAAKVHKKSYPTSVHRYTPPTTVQVVKKGSYTGAPANTVAAAAAAEDEIDEDEPIIIEDEDETAEEEAVPAASDTDSDEEETDDSDKDDNVKPGKDTADPDDPTGGSSALS